MGQACFYSHEGWRKDGMMRALGLREAKVRRIEEEVAATMAAHQARMREGGLTPPQFAPEDEGGPAQGLLGAPMEGGQTEEGGAVFSLPPSPRPEDISAVEGDVEEMERDGLEDEDLLLGVPGADQGQDEEMGEAAPQRCAMTHRNKRPPEHWVNQERERRRKRRKLIEVRRNREEEGSEEERRARSSVKEPGSRQENHPPPMEMGGGLNRRWKGATTRKKGLTPRRGTREKAPPMRGCE